MDAATNVSNTVMLRHIYSNFVVLSRSGCAVDNSNCCEPPLCTRQHKNCQDEICELCKKRAIYERQQVDEALSKSEILLGTVLSRTISNHLTCAVESEPKDENASDKSAVKIPETPSPATATLEAEASDLVQQIMKALEAEVSPNEASKALAAVPKISSNETEQKIVEHRQHVSKQSPLVENQEESRGQNHPSQIPQDELSR